jgi:hypothetical protein
MLFAAFHAVAADMCNLGSMSHNICLSVDIMSVSFVVLFSLQLRTLRRTVANVLPKSWRASARSMTRLVLHINCDLKRRMLINDSRPFFAATLTTTHPPKIALDLVTGRQQIVLLDPVS